MNLSILDSSKSESQLLLTITEAYKNDPFIQDLLVGKVKSISTSHGKYVVLNDIVYYLTKDSKYLLYIPPNAILPDSNISLQEQIIHEYDADIEVDVPEVFDQGTITKMSLTRNSSC